MDGLQIENLIWYYGEDEKTPIHGEVAENGYVVVSNWCIEGVRKTRARGA